MQASIVIMRAKWPMVKSGTAKWLLLAIGPLCSVAIITPPPLSQAIVFIGTVARSEHSKLPLHELIQQSLCKRESEHNRCEWYRNRLKQFEHTLTHTHSLAFTLAFYTFCFHLSQSISVHLLARRQRRQQQPLLSLEHIRNKLAYGAH